MSHRLGSAAPIVTPAPVERLVMARNRRGWADRDLSPANPVRFNYRRVVGGLRLLVTESEPWNLVRQTRVRALKAELVAAVSPWDGVEAGPHRFGGTEFLLAGREVGHIHEFGLMDVPLARPIGRAVVAADAAAHHHVLPDSGWVSTFVDDPGDVAHARALFRLSYCWHVAKYHHERFGRERADVVAEVFDLPLDDTIAEAFAETLAERT